MADGAQTGRRLAIETATDSCSVALFDGDRLIGHQHEAVGRGHAERLVPMIAALPERGRADLIAVDCGPGSFTGIRVGLAAARALGLAWGVPVRGYSSLALLAARAHAELGLSGEVAVAIIGGHGEYFVQSFAGPCMEPITDLASLPPAQAALACGTRPLIGSGAAALAAAGAPGAVHPLATDARWAVAMSGPLANLPPAPVYGRAPDARPAAA